MRPKWLKGVKRCQNGSKGVKTGQKVPKRANEGAREGQNGGEEGQGREKSHEWSISSSLFVRKRSLLGVLAHNVKL